MPPDAPPSSPANAPLRGVLIVESDPDAQWALARALTIAGFRVVGASSLEGAESVLASWGADAVVIGVTLAAAGGSELGHVLRTKHPGTPVLVLGEGDPVSAPPPSARHGAQSFRWDRLREALRAWVHVPARLAKR